MLPSFIAVEAARSVLSALRVVAGHRFLVDDVSLADPDVPGSCSLLRAVMASAW